MLAIEIPGEGCTYIGIRAGDRRDKRAYCLRQQSIVVVDKYDELAPRCSHTGITSRPNIAVFSSNNLPFPSPEFTLQTIQHRVGLRLGASIIYDDHFKVRIILLLHRLESLQEKLRSVVMSHYH